MELNQNPSDFITDTTKEQIIEDKKDIAQKISKKERICVEIDENTKKDLEVIMFYFYRDTSKKMTKKVFEEFCKEKIKEMKNKMIDEMK